MIQLAQSAKRAYVATFGEEPFEGGGEPLEQQLLGFPLHGGGGWAAADDSDDDDDDEGDEGGSASGDSDYEVELELLENARELAPAVSSPRSLISAAAEAEADAPAAGAPAAPTPQRAVRVKKSGRRAAEHPLKRRRRTPTNTTPSRPRESGRGPARRGRATDGRRRARMLADFQSYDRTPETGRAGRSASPPPAEAAPSPAPAAAAAV